MKKITDEMLNDYLDNQLDSASIKELKEEIERDEETFKKLKALKVVDSSLKSIEIFPAPDGFTNRIMNIIAKNSKKVTSKVSFFFVSVISLFSVLILVVMGYAYYASYKLQTGNQNYISLNKMSDYVLKYVSLLQNFFSNQNVTTIGLVLTMLLLISGYYLLESHKEFKNKFRNLF